MPACGRWIGDYVCCGNIWSTTLACSLSLHDGIQSLMPLGVIEVTQAVLHMFFCKRAL